MDSDFILPVIIALSANGTRPIQMLQAYHTFER